MPARRKPSLANAGQCAKVATEGAMPEWCKSTLFITVFALAGWLFAQEWDTETRLTKIEAMQANNPESRLVKVETQIAEIHRRLEILSNKILPLLEKTRK